MDLHIKRDWWVFDKNGVWDVAVMFLGHTHKYWNLFCQKKKKGRKIKHMYLAANNKQLQSFWTARVRMWDINIFYMSFHFSLIYWSGKLMLVGNRYPKKVWEQIRNHRHLWKTMFPLVNHSSLQRRGVTTEIGTNINYIIQGNLPDISHLY